MLLTRANWNELTAVEAGVLWAEVFPEYHPAIITTAVRVDFTDHSISRNTRHIESQTACRATLSGTTEDGVESK